MIQESISLKYDPTSEPLHISVEWLFLNSDWIAPHSHREPPAVIPPSAYHPPLFVSWCSQVLVDTEPSTSAVIRHGRLRPSRIPRVNWSSQVLVDTGLLRHAPLVCVPRVRKEERETECVFVCEREVVRLTWGRNLPDLVLAGAGRHRAARGFRGSSSSLLLSSLESSDTTIYEPYTRAFLGTASHFR